ncbi:MAG: hypothetical protein ABI790_07255 [Betaproteobacteria bacterium]
MPDAIHVERFTRQGQSVSGQFSPQTLPRLAEYLASEEGEIHYSLSGSVSTDVTGSQKRRLKCIISGWFSLADPNTLKPLRYALAIESKLVLVHDESKLPPLEMESDDEDYIVCGSELDVRDRVEEEILLDLPSAFGGQMGPVAVAPAKSGANKGKSGVIPGKISPFARLAELKKK